MTVSSTQLRFPRDKTLNVPLERGDRGGECLMLFFGLSHFLSSFSGNSTWRYNCMMTKILHNNTELIQWHEERRQCVVHPKYLVLSVCLSISLSIRLFVHLPLYLSDCLRVCVYVCLYVARMYACMHMRIRAPHSVLFNSSNRSFFS